MENTYNEENAYGEMRETEETGEKSKLSLDAFTLKIIAIVSMGVHHTIMILWELFPLWLHLPLYARVFDT